MALKRVTRMRVPHVKVRLSRNIGTDGENRVISGSPPGVTTNPIPFPRKQSDNTCLGTGKRKQIPVVPSKTI